MKRSSNIAYYRISHKNIQNLQQRKSKNLTPKYPTIYPHNASLVRPRLSSSHAHHYNRWTNARLFMSQHVAFRIMTGQEGNNALIRMFRGSKRVSSGVGSFEKMKIRDCF